MNLQRGATGVVDVFQGEFHDNFLMRIDLQHGGHFIGVLDSGGFRGDGLISIGDSDFHVLHANFCDHGQLHLVREGKVM